MATITLPAWFRASSFALRQSTNQRVFASPFGGSEQAVDLLNDRWLVSMTLPPRRSFSGAALEALLASFRGQTNTCNLWHMQRPVPRGTMRGTPITNPSVQGADAIILGTGVAGVTLMAGDMIGIDGMLLQVREDAFADGVGAMHVKFVNRLRRAVASGLPVVWDRPTAPFRLMTNASVLYQPGYAEGVSLDFAEAIA